MTVDGNHQKRSVNIDFDSNNTSSRDSALKKAHVDYGKDPKRVLSSLPAGQVEDLSSLHQAPEPESTTNGVAWVLDGSMREAYDRHIPNAMFPEPSSTVPNATLTQQRVLEGVLAPALLGSDIDIERFSFQREDSIPWSEYLKSSTNTGEQPRPLVQQTHVSQNMLVAQSKASPQEHSGLLQLQWDSQASLNLIRSPSIHDTTFGAIDVQELNISPNDEHHSNGKQTQDILLSTANEDIHGNLSSASSKLRKKRPSPVPTSDDDDEYLRLPKEQ